MKILSLGLTVLCFLAVTACSTSANVGASSNRGTSVSVGTGPTNSASISKSSSSGATIELSHEHASYSEVSENNDIYVQERVTAAGSPLTGAMIGA